MKQRERTPERLDDLTVSGPELRRTLGELSRLNAWLGNDKAVVRAVEPLVAGCHDVHIVDVGCGAGDVLHSLGQALRKDGRRVRLTGIDGNPATVAYAKAWVPSGTFEVADVMDPAFVVPECDVLISSHFLYHLGDAEASAFVRRQLPRVRLEVVVSELVRSQWARLGFSVLSSALGVSQWVRRDGYLAIRRAWTQAELDAAMAGVPGARVDRVGLFRQLLRVPGTRADKA